MFQEFGKHGCIMEAKDCKKNEETVKINFNHLSIKLILYGA